MILKNAEFLDIFILMSFENFILSWVEHENSAELSMKTVL